MRDLLRCSLSSSLLSGVQFSKIGQEFPPALGSQLQTSGEAVVFVSELEQQESCFVPVSSCCNDATL
jgi:hypothetical protein